MMGHLFLRAIALAALVAACTPAPSGPRALTVPATHPDRSLAADPGERARAALLPAELLPLAGLEQYEDGPTAYRGTSAWMRVFSHERPNVLLTIRLVYLSATGADAAYARMTEGNDVVIERPAEGVRATTFRYATEPMTTGTVVQIDGGIVLVIGTFEGATEREAATFVRQVAGAQAAWAAGYGKR